MKNANKNNFKTIINLNIQIISMIFLYMIYTCFCGNVIHAESINDIFSETPQKTNPDEFTGKALVFFFVYFVVMKIGSHYGIF